MLLLAVSHIVRNCWLADVKQSHWLSIGITTMPRCDAMQCAGVNGSGGSKKSTIISSCFTEFFNLLSLHKICSVAICIWVESPQDSWHQSDMHRWKGSNFCSCCCTFPTSRNHKIPSRIIINILQWSMINGSFLHLAIYECSKSHALHIFHSNEWSWFFCSRAMTKSLTII